MATTKTPATKITPKSVANANAAVGAQRASTATMPITEPTLPLHHVGHTLKEAREARGLTIENLANELMIRRYYLQAIEDGNYKTLPDRVYAMGFVRSYSDYLGLDGNALTEQFRREAYSGRPQNAKVELSFPEPVSHNIVPGKTALLGGAILACVAVAVGLFMTKPNSSTITDEAALKALPSATTAPAPIAQVANNFDSQAAITTPNNDNTETEITNPTATATTAPAATTAEPTTAAAMPAPVTSSALAPVNNNTAAKATTSPAANPTPVATDNTASPTNATLVIKQTSWIEVRNSQGQTLLSKIAKAGDVLALPNQSGLVLTVGNAGGVVLTVDDKPLATLGPIGEVRRNLKLDTLLQAATPQATTNAAPAMPAPTSLPAPSTTQE